MAASEVKRQEGEMRHWPSKSRNRALELVRLTSCKQQTEEGSIPIGSCNPGHAFVDGIKGQLRGRFYELEMGHALGLHGDGAARLKSKTELLELAQVETVLLALLGRKARVFSSSGRPLFYLRDLFRARLCRNATELGRYGARLVSIRACDITRPCEVEVIPPVYRAPPRYPDSLVSSTTCRETNESRFGAQKVNISLIVHDSEAEQCVRALHSAFFGSDISEVDRECGSQNGSVSILRNGC
ncbi:hypothetical protein CsSME_00004853 [Camellia sinensis var. sinensis]